MRLALDAGGGFAHLRGAVHDHSLRGVYDFIRRDIGEYRDEREVGAAMATAGARDGMSKEVGVTVDGFSEAHNLEVLAHLQQMSNDAKSTAATTD